MNLRGYLTTRTEVQREFDASRAVLPAKLAAVEARHRDNGFLTYSMRDCPRETVRGSNARYFVEQRNEFRARRHGQPACSVPAEVAARRPSRLDLDLVPYTSAFRQFPVLAEINRREYAFLVQPWPFASLHFTVASTLASDPMGWKGQPDRLIRMLMDLCTLASMAPGMVALLNGAGAGATVLDRFHLQLLGRAAGPWPLEALCDEARDRSGLAAIHDPAAYPFAVWSLRGVASDVVPRAFDLITAIHGRLGGRASENLLATAAGGLVTLYVIPRDVTRERSADGAHLIGSLETFGELIHESGPALGAYDAIHRLMLDARPEIDGEILHR